MALPKLTKTKFIGIYFYNDIAKGKVFVAVFRINGKLYRKIVGFENDEHRTTAKIAYIKKEQLVESIKNNGSIVNKELSFNQLWDMYFEHLKNSKSVSQRTLQSKLSTYNCHFKTNFGNLKISQINSILIQKFANEQLKIKAPKTVDNYLTDLSAIWKFAIKNKVATINPILNIDKPKYDNTLEYPLTIEESKRLFNTIMNYKEPLYKGIFSFLLHGRRRNEVLSPTWDMVNLENRTYSIKCEINKAKKNMNYEITDELYDVLINIEPKTGYVFKSLVTGKKIANLRWAWKRILNEANITKNVRIHDLRHLIGEVSLNETDNSMEVVAAILGHSSTRPTRRYAKIQQKVAAAGLKKVFEYLKD